MAEAAETTPSEETGELSGSASRLAILLAMAMFVLVVDTSLMNVSISAVVRRPRHDGQRRPVGDRARGARVGRVHPHRQQGRRPDRSQARVRHRAARLRGRRDLDDAGPDPGPRHHLLGDHRRHRRLAPPAVDAVADPRQLRRQGPGPRLCARRRVGGDRRGGRPADRRLHHDVPVVAPGVPRRGGHHRGRPVRARPREGRRIHRAAHDRPRRRRAVGHRDGRHRHRHPALAGGRRASPHLHRRRRRRPCALCLVARSPQARRQAVAHRSRPVPLRALPARESPARRSSRSRWAA